MSDIVYESHIEGLQLAFRGKVRDVYDLGDALLIVTTDRLSAFDVVLPTPIPQKGRGLSSLSPFWFERTRHLVPHHPPDRPLEEGRHQVGVWDSQRRAEPDRRGDDARLLALLAAERVPARELTAELRQAVRARLSHRDRLEQGTARAGVAGGRGG